MRLQTQKKSIIIEHTNEMKLHHEKTNSVLLGNKIKANETKI